MGVLVTINDITGVTPYDLYICQPNGSSCFYINTINSVPYSFDIPEPYNNGLAYMLKVVDGQNCVITGVTYVQ